MQTLSTGYLFCKDMFLYMKGEAKYVKTLDDNLMDGVAELGIYYSRKKNIDNTLEKMMFKEKSDEYKILQKKIDVFHERCKNFVRRFKEYWPDLPELTDAESVTNVIDAMKEREPTSILTYKFFKLAKLSKEIKELHDRISHVTERMKEEIVLCDKKVEPVQVLQCDDIDLPSFTKHVNEIMRYLREDDNRSIGILGPIGVGKTTVMKRLNNQLIMHDFDVVIWIDYDKQKDANDNTIEIQHAIMRRLELKDREEARSIKENAIIISKALRAKKYMLVIDEVISIIELDKVGIQKDHKFGKVVVASSRRKVIRAMTDQHVEIKKLSKNEALNLFESVCGRSDDGRIKLIADGIVKSCEGLPLVIKLVANYLKGEKDEEVWSSVKTHLQSDTNKAGGCLKLGGIEHAYKLVYKELGENHKKCLLFVTLFPSDHIIHKDNLVECWNAEGFLNSDKKLIRKARWDGAVALKELTDEYLLENSDKHVKMPVYFRKVAIQQKFPGEKGCLSWLPEKNIKHLNEVTWKKIKRMSLIGCETETTLPTSPKCDNISTLLMQNLRIPSNIPDSVELGDEFFRNMKNLRILDLNKTRIKSLPKSTTSLVSLICLYLNGCPLLTELPMEVKNLKKLELLDIQGTSIHSLPEEVGDMTQLRCLRISFSQKGCNQNGKASEVKTTIPDGIISRLNQLEELTIEVGCCSKAWDDIADKIATELSTLEKLSTLDFHFPRVSSLEQFVTKSKSLKKIDTFWSTNTFRSFNITIGCCKMQHPYGLNIPGILANRQLRFSTKEEISSVGEVPTQAELPTQVERHNEDISSIGEVLIQASSFELFSDGVRNLSDFSLENLGALKVCVVGSCKNMTSIVDVSNNKSILQCLEKLHLFDLKLLQCIWKGQVSPGSLANLKVLTLSGCPEITTILNYEQAKALSSLDRVKVEDCAKVVEIIKGEITNVDQSDILNKVTTIELIDLPNLQTLCTSTSMKLKSLVKIVFKRCSNDFDLTNLSNAEKIEKIKCEASWWEDLELSYEEKQSFHPRCDFYVEEEDLSTGATHEGESSKQGGSADPLASDVSKECNGNNLMMSNINYVDHADKHKEAYPDHQKSLESSEGVELVTHQSTNNNASAKKEAFPFQRKGVQE